MVGTGRQTSVDDSLTGVFRSQAFPNPAALRPEPRRFPSSFFFFFSLFFLVSPDFLPFFLSPYWSRNYKGSLPVMEVLCHLCQIVPWTKVSYVLSQNAIFAKICATPALSGLQRRKKRKIFNYWFTVVFREVGRKKNYTNVFRSVSFHSIVCLILGQNLVENSSTYNQKRTLKAEVTGHLLNLIGLADEGTRLGRWRTPQCCCLIGPTGL